jgi:hypothetical protein
MLSSSEPSFLIFTPFRLNPTQRLDCTVEIALQGELLYPR